MSDSDPRDSASSDGEEIPVGGDKPAESVNPMAEIFRSVGNQPPPKELSAEEKQKGKKGCLIAIGAWIAIGVIVRIVMGVVGEDEVRTQPARESMGILEMPLPSSMKGSEIDLGTRRMAARTGGLGMNELEGFNYLTEDEYQCVGELSVSKPITHVEINGWFQGKDLGPQVNDSMFELFYECGDVRRFLAWAVIDWWGDDLGVGLGDESFVECLIEELSEDLALDWFKLPKEDPPSPAEDELWNEMGLDYQASFCAP